MAPPAGTGRYGAVVVVGKRSAVPRRGECAGDRCDGTDRRGQPAAAGRGTGVFRTYAAPAREGDAPAAAGPGRLPVAQGRGLRRRGAPGVVGQGRRHAARVPAGGDVAEFRRDRGAGRPPGGGGEGVRGLGEGVERQAVTESAELPGAAAPAVARRDQLRDGHGAAVRRGAAGDGRDRGGPGHRRGEVGRAATAGVAAQGRPAGGVAAGAEAGGRSRGGRRSSRPGRRTPA